MMEMWRAYKNNELGDSSSKDFRNDLVMLHHRIKHLGDYHNQEQLIAERNAINEGVDALWERYNEFKSVRSVLDPNYPVLHEIALKSLRDGVSAESAVQGAKDAGIIFQTPSSSSKDTLRPKGLVSTAKAKAKTKAKAEPNPTRTDTKTAGGTGGSETEKRGRKVDPNSVRQQQIRAKAEAKAKGK